MMVNFAACPELMVALDGEDVSENEGAGRKIDCVGCRCHSAVVAEAWRCGERFYRLGRGDRNCGVLYCVEDVVGATPLVV